MRVLLAAISVVLLLLLVGCVFAINDDIIRSYWFLLARSGGMALNFLGTIIFIPILRSFLSSLQGTELEVGSHLKFHYYTASFIFVASLIHVVGHIGYIVDISQHPDLGDAGLGTTQILGKDFWVLVFSFDIGLGILKYKHLTGILITLVMIPLYLLALPKVRNLHLKYFWRIHQVLAYLFFGLLLVHGDWRVFVWPLIFIAVDFAIRNGTRRSGVRILRAEHLKGDILKLYVERPPGYNDRSGQYLILGAWGEYHPFSISSGEEIPYLTCHIRSVQDYDWCFRLRWRLLGHDKSRNFGDPTFKEFDYSRQPIPTTSIFQTVVQGSFISKVRSAGPSLFSAIRVSKPSSADFYALKGEDSSSLRSSMGSFGTSVSSSQLFDSFYQTIRQVKDMPLHMLYQNSTKPHRDLELQIEDESEVQSWGDLPHTWAGETTGPGVVLNREMPTMTTTIKRLPTTEEKPAGPKEMIRIKLDGPFAAPSQSMVKFSHIVLVGGGVGLAPLMSIVSTFVWNKLNQIEMHMKKLTLVWVTPGIGEAEWFATLLKLARKFCDIQYYATKEKAEELSPESIMDMEAHYCTTLHFGRPNFEEILPPKLQEVKNYYGQDSGELLYSCFCGPGPLGDSLGIAAVKVGGTDVRYEVFV